MDLKNYYQNNRTYRTDIDKRLQKVIDIVIEQKPKKVLDIGCGSGFLIKILQEQHNAQYSGVDVYEDKSKKQWVYKSCDITKGLPFKNNEFDLVIFGEVIEHIPDPDSVLQDINRVLKKNGKLIVSTPNLVSWANRLLILSGTQPLYTETSSTINLGRRFKILGQGGKVQGHLKVFTHLSLTEILQLTGYKVIKKHGTSLTFPRPINLIDRFLSNFLPLSSDLVYLAEKKEK